MKIINFGSLNIDKVYNVEDFVQPGQTIQALGHSINPGGKGLNQSLAAARAGADVLHGGAIGKDGLFMKELLEKAGADTSCLQILDAPSGEAIIEVTAKGQNRIIVNGGTNRMITEDYILKVLKKSHPGDFVLLQNEMNLPDRIIRLSHEKGCRVVFNLSPALEDMSSLPLNLVDIFMVNEIEAAQLAGVKESTQFEEILNILSRKYPKAAIVMTLGQAGVLYSDHKKRCSHPVFSVKAVDTTAAGDTFCGYFLAALCANKSVENALKEASAASAIAVSRPGAGPSIPVLSEVEEFIKKRS